MGRFKEFLEEKKINEVETKPDDLPKDIMTVLKKIKIDNRIKRVEKFLDFWSVTTTEQILLNKQLKELMKHKKFANIVVAESPPLGFIISFKQ